MASADCLIATEVQQGYAALLAPGGTFATTLTIALTIYVAVFGYRLLLGMSSLTLGEVVPHFIKIGIVVALATSWPSYQALVFDSLFHGPEQLADVIVRQAGGPGTNAGDVLGAVQQVFTDLTDAAGDAWSKAPPPVTAGPTPALAPVVAGATPAAPPAAPAQLPFQLGTPQFIAALLWLSALVMMAASVGILLVVRIVLALLLLLGPVFVAFALFRTTRGLAEGWLRVTIKFALVPLFALPLIAVVVAVLTPIVASLDGASADNVRSSPVLLILLAVLVFAAVMAQAARLGGSIAGSIRLPRQTPLAALSGNAPPMRAVTVRETIPGTSRAETIVQAIDFGSRRATIGNTGIAPGAIATTRTITGPATTAATAPFPENSGRLGQGYRRLAIGQAVAASPAPRRT